MQYEDGSRESGVQKERYRAPASLAGQAYAEGQQIGRPGCEKYEEKHGSRVRAVGKTLAESVQPGDVCAICLGESAPVAIAL